MKTALSLSLLMVTTFLSFPASAKDTKESADVKPATESASVAPVKDYTIINLDGEDIKYSDVIEIWNGLFAGNVAPDFATFDEKIRQNVLRGLVSERLIYKEAIKDGYDKNEALVKRIEKVKKQLIMQGFMEEKSKALVTDDKVKESYAKKLADSKGQEELKARHILLDTEEAAKKLSDSLKKGGDFEKLAMEKSTDKGTGEKGGELGWFSKDKMVAEFYDAAFKLKKGEVSAPVKTSFGWHIIKLEDRRPVEIESFEKSKKAIETELGVLAAQTYVENLLKAASVKYFDENGKEKELSKVLIQPKADEKK
jgi:peptidyl-prolyl cis-trans isomerase C